MRSNKLQSYLGITTFGESHGLAFGLVIEDIKPNIEFPYDAIRNLIQSRKSSSNQYLSARQEIDDYEVLSGVFNGKTTGMPICIIFRNLDHNSIDYKIFEDVFKPGHADYAWFHKFKIYDYRGSGRASGRETISRIAASAFVDEFINPIKIQFQTIQIGQLIAKETDEFISPGSNNPYCWTDKLSIEAMYSYLESIKKEKDTVGGIVKIRISDVPIGLGDPVFEKLNANLSKALMSIGTVKGVSFGDGFELATKKGSEINDEIDEKGFKTNHAGGINGGISNGQPIIINVVIKPVSSHGKKQSTITLLGNSTMISISGRHDVCHIPKVLPVFEAMIKLTLADAISWQNNISDAKPDLNSYREAIDKLDEDLLLTIYKRKSIVNKVKILKVNKRIPFQDNDRENQIYKKWTEISIALDLDSVESAKILDLVLKLCKKC